MSRSTKLSRRAVRYSLIGVNLLILVAVVLFFLYYKQGSVANKVVAMASSSSSSATSNDPLDQVSAADIAVEVADMVSMPEATAVQNQAETVNAQLAITPAEDLVAAKPLIVATALKTREDIQTYVAQSGDTLASIAAKFNITSNSVLWSNGLTSTNITAGDKLVIPPISGIVYAVKSGDTSQSLAQKYNASADQITAFNDAEISGLIIGEQIVIQNGQQPVAAATGYGVYGGLASYGFNGYDFGYCTYWVALRRSQVGESLPDNLGNASSWAYLARAYGLSVGNTPMQYAAAVVSTAGEGHVVFVESVNADGSINISEMNHLGWDIVDHETVPASTAAYYSYIY